MVTATSNRKPPGTAKPPPASSTAAADLGGVIEALQALEATLRLAALSEYTYMVIPSFPGAIQGAVRITKSTGAIARLQDSGTGYHWVPEEMTE